MENTYVGPFFIVKKLGTNRRQQVYHARQTEQDRDVALKFIAVPPEVAWAKALDKIDIEVKELQKLKHPNLVQVYGAGVHEEKIFFANELIEGESLSSILSRRGRITPDLVVEYGKQIADVLRYLHQNDLIHSKLTPEKILITGDHKVKIADLRLNRSKRRRWDSRRHRELDIAAYMAPEQFTEGATPKSDFYALGVILFEMLTGKLPYEPDTMGRMTKMKMNAPVPSAATHVLNCPIWLDKLITQTLQPNPRKRPHSARAIVMAFEEIKKLDSSKKAAVDQMTSGFNALTAGADKSEARRLLGKRPWAQREDEADVSFFQSVPFMIASLLAIVFLVVWMAMPPSAAKLMKEAQAMLQTDNEDKWSSAREILTDIREGGGPLADEAEELYFESRQKLLVRHAERNVSNHLQSENVHLFGKAVRMQQDGRDDEAMLIFKQLVSVTSPDSRERHVYYESLARIEAMKNQIEIPDSIDQLNELIENAGAAQTAKELVAAKETLSKIMLRFAGREGYLKVFDLASRRLQDIKLRLALQEKSSRAASETESAGSEDAEPSTANDG